MPIVNLKMSVKTYATSFLEKFVKPFVFGYIVKPSLDDINNNKKDDRPTRLRDE